MQNKSFIGASSDAVVSCSCCGKGVLQIKCPYSIANQIPSGSNLTNLRKTTVDGKVKLVISHPYYSQVQTRARWVLLGEDGVTFGLYTSWYSLREDHV